MASLEHHTQGIRIQNELKRTLKGKLTKEISAFIENYPLFLDNLIKSYGVENTVLGFKEVYSNSRPSFSDIEEAVKKYEKRNL